METEIEEYVGDMGVIAIIPIVAFFATGVLKKVSDDLSDLTYLMIVWAIRMILSNLHGLSFSSQWEGLL